MAETASRATPAMTERQKKWFASVQGNLETATGRSLAEWVAIARTCPETAPRARSQWLKTEHGLGQNHAAFVLSETFPGTGIWDDPEVLRSGLWKEPSSLAILTRLEGVAARHPDVIQTQRKGYTAWSRSVQFAAARPMAGGRARVAMKLDPRASSRLQASLRRESWSERLLSVIDLDNPDQVDEEVAALFASAAANG